LFLYRAATTFNERRHRRNQAMNPLKIIGWIVAIPLYFAFEVGIRSLQGDARLIAFVIFFGGMGLIVMTAAAIDWRIRRNDRQLLDQLMGASPRRTPFDWELPAPESYLILRGMGAGAKDAFKIGLLQLIADGVFVAQKATAADRSEQTFLVALRPPPQALPGSLAAVYSCWMSASDDPTIRGLAKRARERWGSMDKFADEAARELTSRGFFTREEVMHFRIFPGHRYVHTAAGLAAKARFEGLVADALQQLRTRAGDSSKRTPRRWLIAGVVAAAATHGRLPDDMQLTTDVVELEGSLAATGQPSGGSTWYVGGPYEAPGESRVVMSDVQKADLGTEFDWSAWDDLDSSLTEIDSSVGVDGGGDGGDGGGDGGGGD
jgi:hypothetical protein